MSINKSLILELKRRRIKNPALMVNHPILTSVTDWKRWIAVDKENLTKADVKLGAQLVKSKNLSPDAINKIYHILINHHITKVINRKSPRMANAEQQRYIQSLPRVIPTTSEMVLRIPDVKLIKYRGGYYGTNMRGKIVSVYKVIAEGVKRIQC